MQKLTVAGLIDLLSRCGPEDEIVSFYQNPEDETEQTEVGLVHFERIVDGQANRVTLTFDWTNSDCPDLVTVFQELDPGYVRAVSHGSAAGGSELYKLRYHQELLNKGSTELEDLQYPIAKLVNNYITSCIDQQEYGLEDVKPKPVWEVLYKLAAAEAAGIAQTLASITHWTSNERMLSRQLKALNKLMEAYQGLI